MEQTIKKDNERKVIKQEYLNENSLCETVVIDNSIRISIRFIEHSSVKEHIITTLPAEVYLTESEDRIRISEDGRMLAVFSKRKEEFFLNRLYDLEEHCFSVPDFIDIEYKKHFQSPKLDSHLTYQKVKKDE